jgi:tetratricopeptide (TPR) repeat protein
VASIPTPPPRSLEDAELAEAIEARHAALTRDPDRFAVLGLAPGAGRDDVKRAFIELAKAFHPDRLPRSLHISSSQGAPGVRRHPGGAGVLLDDVRRAEHAARSRGDRPEASDPAAASEALVAGEMAMRRREYAQAEALFREAYEADPRPATLAAAAWAIYMDPSRRAEAQSARAMMVDALKADPDCDRAHYQLGVIARVEGDVDRAEKHFREAVRSNPRHLEAAQELRSLEMRAGRRRSRTVRPRHAPRHRGPRARPCPAARTRCPCPRAARARGSGAPTPRGPGPGRSRTPGDLELERQHLAGLEQQV